jgi:arsenite-transporting ATPase
VTRVRFFAGKGGVGKTTCAAAFALGLAEQRHRTLVVSTDPAHSLGDALQARLSGAPRKVHGTLFAAELDADRALSRWLSARERSLRVIASRGTYLDDDDVDVLFRLSLPGVDELVGLIELSRLAAGFDEVVVDTAPTGHTLRLLQMPETLSRLSQVLFDLQAKHHAMAEALGGRLRTDAEDRLIVELHEEASRLHALLRSPSVEFHWVLLPEELALLEAQDGVRALRDEGMTVAQVVANRTTPKPPGKCALCEARRRSEARVLREARKLGPLTTTFAQEDEPRGLRALAAVARDLGFRASGARGRPSRGVANAARVAVSLSSDGSARRTRDAAPSGHRARAAIRAPRSLCAPQPDAAPPLVALLSPPGLRLLFFGGKGGVGKTTAAAAAALAAAAAGRRVLVLSIDPAHSLGDVLQEKLAGDERAVGERLYARELDAPGQFRARRDAYQDAIEQLFRALRSGSSFDAPYDRAVMHDLIDLSPPGVDEIFALLAVVEALQRHELIVVDTAPTGHALRLFELVPKAREWVQALLQILLKYRSVVGLGTLAQDLTNTARELRELEALLSDSGRTRFVAVTRAAALPRLETVRLLKGLRKLEVAAPAVLINALTPPGCSRCLRAVAREAVEIDALRESNKRARWDMLGAQALPSAPRGHKALLAFGKTWTRIA